MSVVDLHPEDLLDRDAQGLLGESDRARLDAHLAHCSVCRFERQLRADFAEELDGDLSLDRMLGLGSINAIAIDNLKPVQPAPESRAVLRAPPRRRRRTRAVWLLAAAALLVGGVAAAMNGIGEGPWSRLALRPSAPPAPAAVAAPEAPHATTHRAPAPLPMEVADPSLPVESSVPVVAPAPLQIVRPVASFKQASAIGPAELFDTASEARRRGDYERVLDVDHDLETRFPTSREAQVLRVIVGHLLLDRGDPAGALARFDAYLGAGGGELGEEAMVGRATSLDRLGRSDDAAREWGALVAAFPDTPYAAHAKARQENSIGR